MSGIEFNIHGITASLHSDDQGFLEFVEGYYSIFISDRVSNPHLKVIFSPDSGRQAIDCKNRLTHYGDGLYVGDKSLYWENEFGFRILVKLYKPDYWEIYGYHFDLLETERNVEERLKNYTRSMRWVLHFPAFSMLDFFLGMRLVHATAISRNQKAMVFAGLNKVGKSTLGRYIADKYNWKYLSDNFLLTNSHYIYAFPEKGRLSPESMRFLKKSNELKQRIYNKSHIPIEHDRIEMCAKPGYVFLVGNSRELQIDQLDTHQGLKMLESLHRYLKEFPEYTFYSALDMFSFWERTRTPLFSEHTEFYRLSFPMNWNLEDIAGEINKCISIT